LVRMILSFHRFNVIGAWRSGIRTREKAGNSGFTFFAFITNEYFA